VLAISGSLQARSSNLALLELARRAAPPGVEVLVFDGLRHLPHFDPDIEAQGAPESVVAWRRVLAESDALLIASPEYGHSLPGALKNGIDWVIGSGELECKVVAVTAAVPAVYRGRRGLKALCDTLDAVRATIVGGEPLANDDTLKDEVLSLLRALIDAVDARVAAS
jgi:NAD(P)H-dependent FMN reductase